MPLVEAGRALYRQKETKPKKSVSSFAKEEKGRLFTGSSERGNSAKGAVAPLSKNLKLNVKEKENKNWCLATR